MHQTIFTHLQNVLADLYSDEPNIRRIIAAAGIKPARINFGSSASNIWHSVLSEAKNNYQVDALLAVVEQEFERNEELGAACAAYRRSIQRSASSPNPPINYSQTTSTRRPIPELLPYRVNRREQKKEIELAIERLLEGANVPVIYLAHGDHLQCHYEFVKCLLGDWLPTSLKLNSAQNTILHYHLRLPPLRHIGELHGQLREEFVRAIGHPNRKATQTDINQFLVEREGNLAPIFIHLYPYEKELAQHGVDFVKHFLYFWQQWPSLMPGQRLIVYLCIQHERQRTIRPTRKPPWHRLFAPKDPVDTLMGQACAVLNPSEYEGLICAPLTKLSDVAWPDVEDWTAKEGAEFCRDHKPRAELRRLFEPTKPEGEMPSMPMELVVDKVKEILKYID